MDKYEVKKQIDFLRQELKEVANNDLFVLNPKVMEIKKEISILQGCCEHSLENGKCTFCGWVKI